LDDGSDTPEQWLRLRAEVKASDAVLFVTPEYNRSMPAALKNALDVASRPYAENSWSGKPGGVISVSPGKTGAFGANHHLRQTAACLNIYMMQQPEAYIGDIMSSIGADGTFGGGLQNILKKFADAFAEWIGKFNN